MPENDREAFFEEMARRQLSLTFDDVLLRTGPSEFDANEVDLSSQFSRNVELGVPLASAAMDTITEHRMASLMARMGGVGVIHASMTPHEQGQQVRRVKYELQGFLDNPRYVGPAETIGEILENCRVKEWSFRTFPVVDSTDRLLGILTSNEFDFAMGELDTPAEDIMTPVSELVTAKPGINFNEAYALMKQHKKKTLPIVDEDGIFDGMFVWSDVVRQIQGNPERYNLDSAGRLVVAAAVPTHESALERISEMHGYVDAIVLDSAQGDSKHAFRTLRLIKEHYPDLDVVVGNITEGYSAESLVNAGADGIKVGQGPGSICTTRTETGIGRGQITAVHDVVDSIKGSGVPVIADGGLTRDGDFAVAIAAGAHSVMTGRMLAGTEETPQRSRTGDRGVMSYRGMGSLAAMRDGSQLRYGSEMDEMPLAEGVESEVPYIGSAENVIRAITKAIQKSGSYQGLGSVEAIRTRARFSLVTASTRAESGAHHVRVV